jgi:putative phosphoesterase
MGDLLGSARDPEIKAPQGFTIGVLSDTHVPDRRRQLDPRIIKCFQIASVDLIFHAGDISTQAVLDQLNEIAPVRAVRGNRDWMMLGHLPNALTMEINGARLALVHGHGSLVDYVRDRLQYYLHGFQIERYLPRLLASFPASQAIIFGHIHRPLNRTINAQLIFNPGSAHVPDPPYRPSVGIIQISPGGEIQARIVQLGDISS